MTPPILKNIYSKYGVYNIYRQLNRIQKGTQMAEEKTVNCQIRTTEGNRKRFAELAERAGVSQGALLGRLLDDAETDEFGAAHKDYSATIEALDEQCRQLKELYKGLIVTAESTISNKTAHSDAMVEKMRLGIERARAERDDARDEIKRLEAVEGENEKLRGELSKTSDELRRRTARVDELEAERDAVKGDAAKAEEDRAARAEAERARAVAVAEAAAARAELEKAKADAAALKAEGDAAAALLNEKLANAQREAEAAASGRDDLRKQVEALTAELDRARTEAAEAKAALAASKATADALREQAEFAKSLALGQREDVKQGEQAD